MKMNCGKFLVLFLKVLNIVVSPLKVLSSQNKNYFHWFLRNYALRTPQSYTLAFSALPFSTGKIIKCGCHYFTGK
jgi:hypothetical protein